MASLGEVYERKRGGGGHATPRRVLLGVLCFLLGSAMVLVGLIVASTEVLAAVDVGRYESRRIAGVIAGLGVPAVFIGILTVLPASARIRGAAAIGAAIAIVGVVIFWTVYPSQWVGAGADRHYTFETATIYLLGAVITFWCFFVAVANFKTRNDPGGTVELEVLTAGETKIVEVDAGAIRSGVGGIGLFGSDPPTASVTPVGDGGSVPESISSPGPTPEPRPDEGAAILDSDTEPDAPVDRYCGNCRHFDYVKDGSMMRPYCGAKGETMGDMRPCEEWAPNSDS